MNLKNARQDAFYDVKLNFFSLLQCISMTPLLFDTHKNSDEIYYKGRQLGLKSGGVQRGWAEISNLWGGFGSPKNILWETDFCA